MIKTIKTVFTIVCGLVLLPLELMLYTVMWVIGIPVLALTGEKIGEYSPIYVLTHR